jgi:hypothetical protein
MGPTMTYRILHSEGKAACNYSEIVADDIQQALAIFIHDFAPVTTVISITECYQGKAVSMPSGRY